MVLGITTVHIKANIYKCFCQLSHTIAQVRAAGQQAYTVPSMSKQLHVLGSISLLSLLWNLFPLFVDFTQ